jgi:hypothetical protein
MATRDLGMPLLYRVVLTAVPSQVLMTRSRAVSQLIEIFPNYSQP